MGCCDSLCGFLASADCANTIFWHFDFGLSKKKSPSMDKRSDPSTSIWNRPHGNCPLLTFGNSLPLNGLTPQRFREWRGGGGGGGAITVEDIYRSTVPVSAVSYMPQKQGCGSGSGLDPDSANLWIRIRIGNPDPGSGFRGKKIKKFQWKHALFSYL
jgi:hypothetical protein